MPTPLQEGRATRKVTFTVDSATTDSRHNATDYVKGNQVATGAPRPCTPDPSRCPTSRSAGVVTLSGATTPVGRDQSGTEWRLREASTSTFRVRSGPNRNQGAASVPQACTLSRPRCRRADDPACGRSWRAGHTRGSYSISRDGTQRAPPHRTRQPARPRRTTETRTCSRTSSRFSSCCRCHLRVAVCHTLSLRDTRDN